MFNKQEMITQGLKAVVTEALHGWVAKQLDMGPDKSGVYLSALLSHDATLDTVLFICLFKRDREPGSVA